jgi:NDP-sugar pyrophosphorylase family protein
VHPIAALTKNTSEKFPVALILAGGLGKRLRSAYAAGPKAMAPVGTRPFLDYLLHWLRAEGVQEVILCVGYMRSSIERHVGSGRKWGLRVKYSIDRKLLGTAGALKKAGAMLGSNRAFVINGDTFLDVNLREMSAFHRDRRAWATLAVAKVTDARPFGTLRLDSRDRITLFLEKSAGDRNDACARSKWQINGGVYLIEKKLLGGITGVAREGSVSPFASKEENVWIRDRWFFPRYRSSG